MKRRLRLCILLLSVTLGTALGACGASEPGEDRTADTDIDPAGEPAFPATVTNALGTVTVPERPERVVAIGLSELDMLLALAVVPVAYGTYGGNLFDYEIAALDGADAPEAFSLADGTQWRRSPAMHRT